MDEVIGIPVNEFIKNHHHINYCEAIIYKDGSLVYARPSHIETLIRITSEGKDAIWDKCPITESPIHWLVEYTGCVSVWYNMVICPISITEAQKDTIFQLIENRIIIPDIYNMVICPISITEAQKDTIFKLTNTGIIIPGIYNMGSNL